MILLPSILRSCFSNYILCPYGTQTFWFANFLEIKQHSSVGGETWEYCQSNQRTAFANSAWFVSNIALAMITYLLIYISGQTWPLLEITRFDSQFIKGALHCLWKILCLQFVGYTASSCEVHAITTAGIIGGAFRPSYHLIRLSRSQTWVFCSLSLLKQSISPITIRAEDFFFPSFASALRE